jgi:hypothetical protein
MSTAKPQPAAPPPPPVRPARREITIVSHSTLFYWWPVWAFGYLMALISIPWFTGQTVALVPNASADKDLLMQASGTVKYEITEKDGTIVTKEVPFEKRDVLIAPKPANEKASPLHITLTPVHISTSKNVGVIYVLVLLLVIFITNVPMRGLWSVIVVLFVVALVIFLALVGALEPILQWFSILDVRISLGGYLAISTTLLILWLCIVMLFDRQIYMVFTPGQLKVKLAIGDAETVYDTTGMTFEKQRSDLFRHWILGLGSGDLIIRTAGAQGHHFDFANVLFLGRRVREIEEMMRERPVVSSQY